METGLYYLNLLSKADQVRFLRNLSTISPALHDVERNVISDYLSDSYDSLYMFILNSFNWGFSPEGFCYWTDIIYRISNK